MGYVFWGRLCRLQNLVELKTRSTIQRTKLVQIPVTQSKFFSNWLIVVSDLKKVENHWSSVTTFCICRAKVVFPGHHTRAASLNRLSAHKNATKNSAHRVIQWVNDWFSKKCFRDFSLYLFCWRNLEKNICFSSIFTLRKGFSEHRNAVGKKLIKTSSSR